MKKQQAGVNINTNVTREELMKMSGWEASLHFQASDASDLPALGARCALIPEANEYVEALMDHHNLFPYSSPATIIRCLRRERPVVTLATYAVFISKALSLQETDAARSQSLIDYAVKNIRIAALSLFMN